MNSDPQMLMLLVSMQMPFGKYKGTFLCNLPVSYLEWFNRKGFPDGKLGMLLQTMYEIKSNGLEHLLGPLKSIVNRDHIYIFEFKMDQPAKVAIAQIKEKGYAAPYLNNGKPITLIGINFSREERNIVEWVEEEIV